jgi:hypothetical protein
VSRWRLPADFFLVELTAGVLGGRVGRFPDVSFRLGHGRIEVIWDSQVGQLTETARGSGRRQLRRGVTALIYHM